MMTRNSVMTDETQVVCPCCGELAPVLLGTLQDATQFAGMHTATVLRGGKLYRCATCHLKFRFPIEDSNTYNKLYDHGDASNWTGDVPRLDWDLIVQYLGDAGSDRPDVLDFGCNTGELLGRLGSGYRKFGIEINQAAADTAVNEYGVQVWSSIEVMPADKRFDVIVAVDVVEHMPDPELLIRQLVSRLAVGGRLILTTGDADNRWWNRFGANWWYCFHPEHIAFVSRPWLDYVTQRSKLSVIECKRFRYRKLGVLARGIHALFMIFYGVLPSIYLSLRNTGRRLLSRPDVSSVLGNGVSADHLFIVLSSKIET